MAQLLGSGMEGFQEAAQDMGSQIMSGAKSVGEGDFGPLIGDNAMAVLKDIKGAGQGLLNKINPDPTKDPYQPSQPLAYDDKGTLLASKPNPYVGLLAEMTKGQQSDQMPSMPAASMPMMAAPAPMPSNVKLARQAYGKYY